MIEGWQACRSALARRPHPAIGCVVAIGRTLAAGTAAKAQLDQTCTVSALNRKAPVRADGTCSSGLSTRRAKPAVRSEAFTVC
jgi:hypothetical protein